MIDTALRIVIIAMLFVITVHVNSIRQHMGAPNHLRDLIYIIAPDWLDKYTPAQ